MNARTPAYRRRLKPADVVKQLMEPYRRHRAAIDRRIEQTNLEVAKIDPRMQDRFRREAERETRSRAGEQMAPDHHAMMELREAMLAQQRHYTPEAIRARAQFDSDPLRNAQIGSYHLARLAAASVQELRLLADEAASEGELAQAMAIRREVLRRSDVPDEVRADVLAAVDQVPLPPEEAAVFDALEQGLREIALTETRIAETTSGKSRPLDRLAVAYGDHSLRVGVPDADGSSASPADRLHAAYSSTQ